jgi:DNA-binding transcriptional ArsR family regulator
MNNRSYVPAGHPADRLLAEPVVSALAETFRVLGDTTRVRLIDALSRSELCVQDLADALGLTQSAVSHQLRLLRSMRLVRTRRDGRQIFYALDDDHIIGLFKQGLEHVEERTDMARVAGTPRPYQARERGAKRAAPAVRTSRAPRS